jgi:hypothetical protein
MHEATLTDLQEVADMTVSNQLQAVLRWQSLVARNPRRNTGKNGACAVKRGPAQGMRLIHSSKRESLSNTSE